MKQAVVVDPSTRESTPHLASWYTPGLSDGLGDRLLMFDNTTASSLELLRVRRDFSDRAEFEAAVRERLRELEKFDHPGIAKVRALKWLGEGEGLALISNHTVGQRLSDVLQAARGPALGLDLIRQIIPVLADLHQQGEGIAHGVLTPERIVVTPGGRLVVVEHVLGSALQALGLPPHRLRSDLGLAVRGADAPLDSGADVVQLGLAALSLVLGRRLDPAEYPLNIASLLDELELIDAPGSSDFSRLQGWLQHALQLGGRAFGSAVEAHDALRDVLEERDSTPRQNVLAFPAAIEISSHGGAPFAAVGPAPADPGWDQVDLRPATETVDAPARAGRDIRLTIELPRSPLPGLIVHAFGAIAAAAWHALRFSAGAAASAGAWIVRSRVRRSAPVLSEPVLILRPAPPRSRATRVLAVVCVIQSLIIAALVATRPPPVPAIEVESTAPPASIQEAGKESPARPRTGARAAGQRADATANPGAASPSAAADAAKGAAAPNAPPPSFGRAAWNGVKTVGSAVWQGARDVWRYTVDLADSAVSRVSENLRR